MTAITSESTVFIVDDNPEVTNALKWLIESVDYSVVTHLSAQTFLDTYQGEPGCLVLDVRMPEMSGFELQNQLITRKVELPILFITGHGDIPMAVHAMKRGALDFLTKPLNNHALLESINQAMRHNQNQRQRQLESMRFKARWEQLTPRERQVMTAMVDGKMTKTIANDLSLSPHTIELHRSKVIKKMQVPSIAALVKVAITYQLLDKE